MPFPLLKENPEKLAETLEKASHDVAFLVEDLREALNSAGPVVSLLILGQIEKAAALRHEIGALKAAIETEGQEL